MKLRPKAYEGDPVFRRPESGAAATRKRLYPTHCPAGNLRSLTPSANRDQDQDVGALSGEQPALQSNTVSTTHGEHVTQPPVPDAEHTGRAVPGRAQEQPEAQPARLLTPSVLAHPDIIKNWPPPPPSPQPQKQPASPFAAADYTFTLDTMTVMSLCSALRDDQDQIVASVTVNAEPTQVATYPKPGVGVGLHNLGFVLPAIHLASPTDKIVFNYTIVNVEQAQGGAIVTVVENILKSAASSAVSTEINQTLKGLLTSGAGVAATAATGAAEAAGGAVGTLVFPVIGSAVGALVGFLIGEGFTALMAKCNAVVASEQFGCTGEYLWEQTHSGNTPWTLGTLTQHPGSKAKDGCTTSYYETYWTCKAS